MNTLILDTETTGLADFDKPLSHPSQPRLCQLGALLYDGDWALRAEVNLIVRPFGFDIPINATQKHGIDTKTASDVGIPELTVLDIFDSLLDVCNLVVAHNVEFDVFVIRKAWNVWKKQANPQLFRSTFCTMRAMTDVCKLPGKFDKYKFPTLTEAYQHCFGKDFSNKHDAMADVRACAEVYRWLKTPREPVKPKEPLVCVVDSKPLS